MAWQEGGTCREMPDDASDELFFPEGRSTAFIEHRAAKVCQRCPILPECRSWALSRHEEFGVWGGLTPRQRRDIWKKENRQLV
jgi:WhiB family transcriptional regulator, redox-sensing transcriptional regulator